MPRSATRKADAPVVTGAMHGDRPTQRTVSASAAPVNGDATKPANSVFALARTGRTRRILPPLDADELQVRTDLVPVRPPGGRRKGQTRYDDIFAKLTADGQSLSVPIAYKGALSKAATAYCRAHPELGASRLRVLTINSTTAGVFRMARSASR